MEQVYWLSRPIEAGTDTRMLVYRYGNFVYAGAVITEPVAGLEYLPGVLQGIQAVQGQIPYISEHKDLPNDSPHRKSLRALEAAIDCIHAEVAALEPRLAEAAANGAAWLDEDDAAIYFEFEARRGFSCNHSDVVFAKSYREDVLLTVIWYGPSASFYVSLSPAGGEEQALVDTLFPSIYGKRRGLALASYDVPSDIPLESPKPYNGSVPVASVMDKLSATADADGKVEDRSKLAGKRDILPAWLLFSKVSVWEASEPVPDPDDVRERDELRSGLQDLAIAMGSDVKDSEGEEDEDLSAIAEPVIDISGGNGYTQVYAVMTPPSGLTTKSTKNGLVPRSALFRFGDWVYAGVVEFPVDDLRLGDVPNLLPALQKQQGRLAFLSEATAFPIDHPFAPTMQTFMGAVSLLRQEMSDSQDEVAALAEQSVNAWIDAEWAASFFELAFQPETLPPSLAEVEVIACKIYLTEGTGVILHVVYFQGSMYCVLSDSVEDVPLLDVAFPDVTARNRAVQVRTYADAAARKAVQKHGGVGVCPLPKCLRVWEGRRRGVTGVGYGAPSALADASDAASAIREKARLRAEKEAQEAAAAGKKPSTQAAAATTKVETSVKAEAVATTAKVLEAPVKTEPAPARAVDVAEDKKDDDEDIYDMRGVKTSVISAPKQAPKPEEEMKVDDSSAVFVPKDGPAFSRVAYNPYGGLARAPHHLAPMQNRLQTSAGDAATDSKWAEAPWDTSGKPKTKA